MKCSFGELGRVTLTSVACLAALGGLEPRANASGSYTAGVCLMVTAASSGTASYGSNTGCVGFGVGLSFTNLDGSASITTDPVTMDPELTTGLLELTSGNTGDNGSVFASLEQGKLRAGATGGTSQQVSEAVFYDVLHFATTDGATSAPVTVFVHLDGSQTGTGTWANGLDVNFAGATFSYFTAPSPLGFGFSGCCPPTGFASYQVTNLSADGLDFTGVVNVTNGENTSALMALHLACGAGEDCDYTNTGTFNWALPGNVTVTSDSGVFLGQAAPEPASMVLIGIGLAAVGVLRIRRDSGGRRMP